MKTEKTTRLYEHLSLERFRPSAKRGWKRRLGCWLWTLIWMVLVSLALWGLFAWATGRVTGLTGVTSLTMAKPAAVRLAGFGVPEWVAYGVAGTVVMGILARLGWGAMQEAFQIREMGKPPEHDPLEVGGNAIPPSGGRVRPSFVPPPPPVNRVVRADWTGVSFGKDQVGGNAIPPSDKAQTFEAHGKVWTRHVPGDPMPCEGITMVEVLLRWELNNEEPYQAQSKAAAFFLWGNYEGHACEIVGWRPVEVSESQGLPVSKSSTKEGTKA